MFNRPLKKKAKKHRDGSTKKEKMDASPKSSVLFLLLKIVVIIFLISYVEVNIVGGVEELPPANQRVESPSLVVNRETAVKLMADPKVIHPRLLGNQMMTVLEN